MHAQEDCTDIQGISVPSNTREIAGVVTIEDEAMVCADVVGTTAKYGVYSADSVNDIKQYLARPFSRASANITASPGQLLSIDITTLTTLRNFVGATAWERMRGAVGLRGTLVFRVVVTATPFHQGVLALTFQYGVPPGSAAADARRATFYQLAPNLPHVKLDLAENTSAELRVPFVSQYEYWPIVDHVYGTNTDFGYGTFSLTKLTDVRVIAGQTAPSYTLYTSIEDAEIIGACPINIGAINLQAGGPSHKVGHHSGPPQKAGGKQGTISQKEGAKAGIVSGILDASSGVAKAISRIPTFEAIGGSTAWFLSAAAKTASAFGYSRPSDVSAFGRVVNNDYRGESQIDMPTSALLAGPFQNNCLVVDGTVGCVNEDHMAFDKILSVPSYIYRKVWSDTVARNDILYGAIVSPSAFWFRDAGLGNVPMPSTATLTTSAFLPSTLMYVGSNFRYWRGDLKFTFHFSKTKLHGGRIMISYTPDHLNATSAPATTSINTSDTSAGADLDALTTMFDLKDGNVVEFIVPYMALDAYTGFNERIGAIAVNVISPLNAPTNASGSIDMMVFVEAMPGFEFAGITPSTLHPHNPRSNHTAQTGIYLQAGGVTNIDDASQRVIGEVFKSVKQVAMVPDYYTFDRANASTFLFTLYHWFKTNYPSAVSGTTPLPDADQVVFYGSKSSRMAELFSFVNGSTDWSIISERPDAGGLTVSVSTAPNDSNVSVTPIASLYNCTPLRESGFMMNENRGSFRVRVPAYSRYFRIPYVRYQFDSGANQTTSLTDLVYSATMTLQLITARIRNSTGSTVRFTVGRAAGDDATMAHFVGPPLCCLWQSTKPTSPSSSADNF